MLNALPSAVVRTRSPGLVAEACQRGLQPRGGERWALVGIYNEWQRGVAPRGVSGRGSRTLVASGPWLMNSG